MTRLQEVMKSHKLLSLRIWILNIFYYAPSIAVPFINSYFIDKYLIIESRPVGVVIGVAIGLTTSMVIWTIMEYIQSWFLGKKEAVIGLDASKGLYKKAQKIRIKEFDTNNTGFFYTRLADDSVDFGNYKTFIPASLIGILIAFGSNIISIFVVDWQIGLVAIIISLVSAFVLSLQRKVFEKKFGEIRKNADINNTFMANSISGIREIKNFNIQDSEMDKYKVIAKNFRLSWVSIYKMIAVVMTAFTLVSGITTLVVVIGGTYNINRGILTIGQLSAISAFASKIMEPILKLMQLIGEWSRGKVSAERVESMLGMEEEINNGAPMKVTNGEIEFKDVLLKYTKDTTALNKVSFKVAPGEHVAFVGSTGSGKSTILKALVRHYDLTSGEILVDGFNISESSVSDLRDGITYISQEGYLSNDTIKHNIEFGKLGIEDDKYNRALEWSDSKQFIEKSPKGDLSMVGTDGVKLSGGQKQRLTIARGLLKDSKIILFDESTSALDNKTERVIQRNIEEWTKDKTTITVAHRLSTIRNSDKILVLEKGAIVESGTHDELVKLDGKYLELLKASEEE